MEPLLLPILGAIALVLLALIIYPTWKWKHERRGTGTKPIERRRKELPPLPPIPPAPEGAEATWAVIDLQTTGLSTVEGAEDLILEASWLILDSRFKALSRHTYRIKQSKKSTPEALQIHGITDTLHSPYSITEEELVEHLFRDLSPRVTLVAHNVVFDLAILRGTLARVAPRYLPMLLQLPTLCTMTYLAGGTDASYPSLLHLTQQLTATPPSRFYALRPTSWRHCYFTYLCLVRLLN